jgi:peptide deformylase
LVCINPEIIHREGEVVYDEGCLSVPGSYEKVVRADKVVMRAQDKYGEVYEMEGSGLLGEAMQHEVDHLNGILYIDLLSPMKRNRARKRLEKFKRMQSDQ